MIFHSAENVIMIFEEPVGDINRNYYDQSVHAAQSTMFLGI